ncbi:MAG: 50S ribosomal protein L29 [Candidatus Marinimicrobia bacterium]|jgi:large subunit ribosomal protein L29|nr:50S ribosomal protein L29 [Candidatus Neomarinimicrobiota bacterium]MEE3152834.1 50S ribosomal protein L29 [Candidatus Neomarinimicrobiota bacterium]|tara:strand:+ start:322 stop:534 length:213 start_codon:yes stop_codon:yes gene_type:complete
MVDNNLNESPKSELFIKLEENKEALQNLNFQKSMQQLEDLSQIRKIKKEIARIKTIIHQYESNIKTEGNN